MFIGLGLGLNSYGDGAGASSLRLIGTGLRLPTTFYTRSGNNYLAGDMAMGMPDYDVSELYFFFPTFYCAAAGEADCANGYTLQGIATRDSEGLCTLGQIDDGTDPVSITNGGGVYGKWVKFTPASPIAAGTVQVFRFAQQIPDGNYPRSRDAGAAVANIFGTTTQDERSQGSASTLLGKLSGSDDLTGANGNIVFPAACMAYLPASVPGALVLGDSIGYGANQTNTPELYNHRHAFGYMSMGLDDNVFSTRIAHTNWCVPGWGHNSTATTQSHGNATACARQLWAMAQARALNDDEPLVDMIFSQHGTNSSGSQAAFRTSYEALASIWRDAVGDETTPIYQAEILGTANSTDGYATVGNQSVSGANDYPTGVKWLANVDIGGADGLGDASAYLRANGTIQGSFAPWRVSAEDLTTQRDLFSVRAFTTTLASNYSGTGDVELTDEPALGDYLSLFDGTNAAGFIVKAVSGTGPYTVSAQFRSGGGTSFLAANTDVQSIWHDLLGIHPGPLAHVAYMNDALVPFKIALGYEAAASVPSFLAFGISGTAEDGEVLTASAVAVGNPAPTVSYHWQKNGSNISGQTSATITLDQSGMGLVVDDVISCEISATNSQGTTTVEPSTPYTNPAVGSLIVGNPQGYFVDPSNVPGSTTRLTFLMDINAPSITSGMFLFTQSSTGCDLKVQSDGSMTATIEDSTGAKMMTNVTVAPAGSFVAAQFCEIEFDVNMATEQVTLTADGNATVTAFTSSGTGTFQTTRNVSFLAGTTGASPVPVGTEVRNLSVNYNGTLHKAISNAAATANADPWKQGGDFTDG